MSFIEHIKEVSKEGGEAITYFNKCKYLDKDMELHKHLCNYVKYATAVGYFNGVKDGFEHGLERGYKEGVITGTLFTLAGLGLVGACIVEVKKKIRVYR